MVSSDSELNVAGDSAVNSLDAKDAEKDVGASGVAFDVLAITSEARNMYGLRHQDYQRYRHYCTRRIAHLRKLLQISQVTATTNKATRRFLRKPLPSSPDDARVLHVALFDAERAWAYAMEDREGVRENPKKRSHVLGKLKRAVEHANLVVELCKHLLVNPYQPPAEESAHSTSAVDPSKPLPPSLTKLKAAQKSRRVLPKVDHLSVLDAEAYAAQMAGILAVERRDWQSGKEKLGEARYGVGSFIWNPLAFRWALLQLSTDPISSPSRRTLAVAALDALALQLRFCNYNLRLSGQTIDEADEAVPAASKAGDVDGSGAVAVGAKVVWRAKELDIANNRIAEAVVRAGDAEGALQTAKAGSGAGDGGADSKEEHAKKVMDAYDAVLEAWWEAQREAERDVKEEESASKSGPGTTSVSPRLAALRIIASYAAFRRLTHTVDRNMVLAADIEARLAGGKDESKADGTKSKGRRKGKKDVPRREEVAKVWDGVVQILTETQELYAVQADPALLAIVSARTTLARAHNARSEAEQALRRVGRLPTAQEDGKELKKIAEECKECEGRVGGEKVAVRARWAMGDQVKEGEVKDVKAEPPLITHLHTPTFTFTPSNPNLVSFPPIPSPVVPKPVFFDVSVGSVKYDRSRLEGKGEVAKKVDKKQNQRQEGQGQAGWFGGWFGAGKK
ncbi:signal recognition particle subunit srp68 [Gonapodya sp. JEL0774]|nr:signal recognition particle subunit srp68 [Gonapodya sp. JEL0774]